jgi:hypothetical protein
MNIHVPASKRGSKVSTVKVNHHQYRVFCTRDGRYCNKRMRRSLRSKLSEGIRIPLYVQETVLGGKVSFYPEAAAFTFYLDGCPRILFNYLVFFELNVDIGRFKWNPQVMERFITHCSLFKKEYRDTAIKQALRRLVKDNIVLNYKRGEYLINPLITGGSNEAGRRDLIKKYTAHLIKKGKDPDIDFYPLYSDPKPTQQKVENDKDL